MGLVDFLKFLKKDAWMLLCVCVLIFHFNVLLRLLSDNVQVKYRSKVVKYIWPMPHQAESIPWVQIQLANGDTLQTKLLVRFSHTHKHPYKIVFFSTIEDFFLFFSGFFFFLFFFLLFLFFFNFFRLVQMGPTRWCEKAWEYPR